LTSTGGSGPAFNLDPPLLSAIWKWCHESDKVVVGWEKVDKAEATSREQAQIKLDIEERREHVLRQKQKQNNSAEVVMLPTTADLKDALDAFAGCSGADIGKFLKNQIDARILAMKMLEKNYSFKVVKGVPNGAPSGVRQRNTHLKGLLEEMIKEDAKYPGILMILKENAASFSTFSRQTLRPPEALASNRALQHAADEAAAEEAAAYQDDMELLDLKDRYLEKKFTTIELVGRGIRKSEVREHYQVKKVFWCVKGLAEPAWCAECVLLDERGEIPKGSLTKGGAVLEKFKVAFDFSEMDQDIERFIRHGPRFP